MKDIHGSRIQHAGYYHANMFATKLRVDLQLHGTEMLALIQEMATAVNKLPIDNAQPPPPFAANAAIQDTV